jgi:tetratricopeptide (TPR) repeat protein
MHRLVQEVVRDRIDEQKQRMYAERVIRAVSEVFPSGFYETWKECERIVGQGNAAAELIDKWDIEAVEAGLLLHRMGIYYDERGQYYIAEPLKKRSLRIWERTLGEEHSNVADGLNNLAEFYRYQGEYAEAEPLYGRSLRIREKVLGDGHPDVAESLNNLGNLYFNQGKYAEAEPLYERALIICENALGEEHPNVVTVLENYATLLRETQRDVEAEEMLERAGKIRAEHTRKNPTA